MKAEEATGRHGGQQMGRPGGAHAEGPHRGATAGLVNQHGRNQQERERAPRAQARREVFTGDREQIRERAAQAALTLLLRGLERGD